MNDRNSPGAVRGAVSRRGVFAEGLRKIAGAIEPDQERCIECGHGLPGEVVFCPLCGTSTPNADTDYEIVVRDVNDETWETLVDAMTDAGIERGCIRRE